MKSAGAWPTIAGALQQAAAETPSASAHSNASERIDALLRELAPPGTDVTPELKERVRRGVADILHDELRDMPAAMRLPLVARMVASIQIETKPEAPCDSSPSTPTE